MSLGNVDTARMLHAHLKGDMFSERRMPKGFKRIGSGVYRLAVLDKSSSLVYKVGSYDANVNEAANSRRLSRLSTRSLGFEVRIPKSRTYRMNDDKSYGYVLRTAVAVQEYAMGANPTHCAAQDTWKWKIPNCNCSGRSAVCFKIVHDRVKEWSGMDDIHGHNVLMDKSGTFWVIDMGE